MQMQDRSALKVLASPYIIDGSGCLERHLGVPKTLASLLLKVKSNGENTCGKLFLRRIQPAT